MNILLLGGGGREHALAWKLAQSRLLAGDPAGGEGERGRLFAAPGNPGIAEHATCFDMDATDHELVIAFCEQERIGLVVIGPEGPLVDGLADSLRGEGIAVFGPSRAAAQLEGSKGFTKDLCRRHGIPTAAYVRAASAAEALAALDGFAAPYVLKADGLAAGKGVVIAPDRAAAEAAVADIFAGAFGAAGASLVIEEFMDGEEVSVFALADGPTVLPFGTAQDHKRVGDRDTGPNTGGMGAYSPAAVLTADLHAQVLRRIIVPTIEAMVAEGAPYSGVLYAGIMLTAQGPKLVEYNCRFGDPEAQVLMMRLDGDLGEYLLACAQNRLATMPPARFAGDAALTVVVAARGYPGTPERGGAIGGIAAAEATGAKVFHAGTELTEDGALVASGGRVLAVTATGASVAEAQALAYRAVDALDFPTGFCRRDIGWREVARAEGAAG